MFKLEATGQILALDTPFVLNDISYPANWLRLASAEEKTAVGIIEVQDSQPYDPRYYWGYDAQGSLTPRDLEELKSNVSASIKDTANKMLVVTDWMVIRQLDNGTPVPEDVKAYRGQIRALSQQKCAAVANTKTFEEFISVVTAENFYTWFEQ